ncbi:hypothetical protein AYO20_08875 [Fonsecaea nubica]|uniref:Uncharacterized protein n=1 Tax=Fonsecaea nubica TaxID=856822 RepID=A0A178CJM0_9EURO|nr:hypothetical protein AYO20_08875 [Fonsecaea nubica]OAL30159.1 hypothetical protein AYO20_08875 [Fonsecaea nubica]
MASASGHEGPSSSTTATATISYPGGQVQPLAGLDSLNQVASALSQQINKIQAQLHSTTREICEQLHLSMRRSDGIASRMDRLATCLEGSSLRGEDTARCLDATTQLVNTLGARGDTDGRNIDALFRDLADANQYIRGVQNLAHVRMSSLEDRIRNIERQVHGDRADPLAPPPTPMPKAASMATEHPAAPELYHPLPLPATFALQLLGEGPGHLLLQQPLHRPVDSEMTRLPTATSPREACEPPPSSDISETNPLHQGLNHVVLGANKPFLPALETDPVAKSLPGLGEGHTAEVISIAAVAFAALVSTTFANFLEIPVQLLSSYLSARDLDLTEARLLVGEPDIACFRLSAMAGNSIAIRQVLRLRRNTNFKHMDKFN